MLAATMPLTFEHTGCRRPATSTWARQEDRVIVSADTDFGVILASQAAAQPSFVLLREPNLLAAQDYATILISALPLLEPEFSMGCVAVFRNGRLRVRRLPFSD